jgi:carbonic anhydrase
VDQGRNWGWQCSKGFEQSPVDIPGLIQKDQEPDARFTIRFGMATPTPALKIEIGEKHFWVSSENPMAYTVVHPPEDPDSALSFKMVKAHIKSPSEHTVTLQH